MKRLLLIFLFLAPSILYSQQVDSAYYDMVIHFDGQNREEKLVRGEWIGKDTTITHKFGMEIVTYECYKKIGHNYFTRNNLGESIRITVMPSGNVIFRNEEHTESYTVYKRI